MNGTLYSSGLLNAPVGLAASAVIGFCFGACLERAGFGSSRKLTAIFYFRDMAVLKVMFSAVVTAMVGYHGLVALGWMDPGTVHILDTYWGAQIVGGLLFGVGFVMGGWCPGTAFAGLASAKWDAGVFLAGTVLGSVLFNEVFAWVAPLYDGGHVPALFLARSLHLPERALPLLFSVLAVGAFAGAAWLERRFGGAEADPNTGRPGRKLAALALVILAVAVWVADPDVIPSTDAAARSTAVDGGVLAEIDAAADHIEPAELAGLLMGGAEDVVLVDIRPPEDYARFHIRGAVNMSLSAGAAPLESLPRDRRVILYSNGTTHAAQTWLLLRQARYTRVQVLTDGILGFWRQCLTPPSLAPGVVDPVAAQAAGRAYAAREAFFVDAQRQPLPAPAVAAAPRVAPVEAAPPPAAMAAPGLDRHAVDVDWLAGQLGRAGLKVLDARSESSKYTAGHIAGAVYINIENLRTTLGGVPSMLAPAEDLARAFGRLGVRPTDTVVVYDDRLRDATLAAVALERVGHPSYAVLLGGFQAWTASGRPVVKDIPAVVETAYVPRAGADTFTIGLDDTRTRLGDGKTVIVDVRPPDYFAGEKSDEARAGHIPGAVNRPFAADLVPDSAIWRARADLAAAYEALGVTTGTPVVVHCRTGHQASQTYFLLKHLLGVKDVRWMDASWSGWAARQDLPVAVGN